MTLNAIALPILPGKTEEWRSFAGELNGARHEEYVESRLLAGVHERTFLQPAPTGDLVIVTLEGDDPEWSFGHMMSATDPFTTWFLERIKAIHGLDLAKPTTDPTSESVLNSNRVPLLAM